MINIKSENNFNYIEIVLVKKKLNQNVYDIDFDEPTCSCIINKVMTAYPKNKFFKKHNTKYLYDSLEMCYCNTEHLKTCSNMLLMDYSIYELQNSKFLINMYNKTTLPNHSFPSSIRMQDIIDSKRLSMKITNNIYINIDSLKYEDNTIVRHIYINVNVKHNNDIIHINETLDEVIKSLTL
jgi:hypothetical protein